MFECAHIDQAPPQHNQQNSVAENLQIKAHGTEDNMNAEDNKAGAENNMDAKANVNDEGSETSDAETVYETAFKEAPKRPSMIKDPIFGHWRPRNAVDDDRKSTSKRWDAWCARPKEERARGRKPLGYKHGDDAYTYEEWLVAKRRRLVNMRRLFAFMDESE